MVPSDRMWQFLDEVAEPQCRISPPALSQKQG